MRGRDEGPVDRMLSCVERFNREIVGFPVPGRPVMLDKDRAAFALEALTEELTEFMEASSLEGQADAMVDLIYFAMGRIVEMGLCPGALFDEVHAANMRKERGARSKRPSSAGFDAVKPPGWKQPDLAPYLSATREEIRRATRRPRLAIIGHAGHGKDTAATILANLFGLRFRSSSDFCLKTVVYPALKDKYGYRSEYECRADKKNRRADWFTAISEFNAADPARLGRQLMTENDIYCGIRSRREFEACCSAGLFDAVLWIDRSKLEPSEPPTSMELDATMATIVVPNNHGIDELEANLELAMEQVYGKIAVASIVYGS